MQDLPKSKADQEKGEPSCPTTSQALATSNPTLYRRKKNVGRDPSVTQAYKNCRKLRDTTKNSQRSSFYTKNKVIGEKLKSFSTVHLGGSLG